jgi:hypothetical protein
MRKSPSEKIIQRQIKDLLEIKKIPFARINSGFIFTGKYMVELAPEGFPDLLFFFNGVHAVEVKKEGEDLRPPQLRWRDILLKNGVGHTVARSPEDVEVYLSTICKSPPPVEKPVQVRRSS